MIESHEVTVDNKYAAAPVVFPFVQSLKAETWQPFSLYSCTHETLLPPTQHRSQSKHTTSKHRTLPPQEAASRPFSERINVSPSLPEEGQKLYSSCIRRRKRSCFPAGVQPLLWWRDGSGGLQDPPQHLVVVERLVLLGGVTGAVVC